MFIQWDTNNYLQSFRCTVFHWFSGSLRSKSTPCVLAQVFSVSIFLIKSTNAGFSIPSMRPIIIHSHKHTFFSKKTNIIKMGFPKMKGEIIINSVGANYYSLMCTFCSSISHCTVYVHVCSIIFKADQRTCDFATQNLLKKLNHTYCISYIYVKTTWMKK